MPPAIRAGGVAHHGTFSASPQGRHKRRAPADSVRLERDAREQAARPPPPSAMRSRREAFVPRPIASRRTPCCTSGRSACSGCTDLALPLRSESVAWLPTAAGARFVAACDCRTAVDAWPVELGHWKPPCARTLTPVATEVAPELGPPKTEAPSGARARQGRPLHSEWVPAGQADRCAATPPS
jgi:hypothetical protein